MVTTSFQVTATSKGLKHSIECPRNYQRSSFSQGLIVWTTIKTQMWSYSIFVENTLYMQMRINCGLFFKTSASWYLKIPHKNQHGFLKLSKAFLTDLTGGHSSLSIHSHIFAENYLKMWNLSSQPDHGFKKFTSWWSSLLCPKDERSKTYRLHSVPSLCFHLQICTLENNRESSPCPCW